MSALTFLPLSPTAPPVSKGWKPERTRYTPHAMTSWLEQSIPEVLVEGTSSDEGDITIATPEEGIEDNTTTVMTKSTTTNMDLDIDDYNEGKFDISISSNYSQV